MNSRVSVQRRSYERQQLASQGCFVDALETAIQPLSLLEGKHNALARHHTGW